MKKLVIILPLFIALGAWGQTPCADTVLDATGVLTTKPPGKPNSEMIKVLRAGERLCVLEYRGKYIRVVHGGDTGYTYRAYIIPLGLKTQPDLADDSITIAYKKSVKDAYRQRLNSMIAKYGSENGTKVAEYKIWLGMTKEMAIDVLGLPDDINRTVGNWGVHEQWVYKHGEMYLYFENGKLKSWQD